MNNEPMYIVVDLFCGAGGVTTGFAQATFNDNANAIQKSSIIY